MLSKPLGLEVLSNAVREHPKNTNSTQFSLASAYGVRVGIYSGSESIN